MIMQESKSPMAAPQEQELEDLVAAAKRRRLAETPVCEATPSLPDGFRAQSIISHLGEKLLQQPCPEVDRQPGQRPGPRRPNRPHDRQVEHQVVHDLLLSKGVTMVDPCSVIKAATANGQKTARLRTCSGRGHGGEQHASVKCKLWGISIEFALVLASGSLRS